MRRMLKEEEPDVICFQEMRWPATFYIPKEYKCTNEERTAHPIYVRKSDTLINTTASSNSFASNFEVIRRYDEGWLFILNAHLSCDDEKRIEQLQILHDVTKAWGKHHRLLICGDFNATPGNVMPYFPHLKLLSQDICTYESFETGAGACIDHFIGNIEGRYVYIDEDSWGNGMSDHYPIMIEI